MQIVEEGIENFLMNMVLDKEFSFEKTFIWKNTFSCFFSWETF